MFRMNVMKEKKRRSRPRLNFTFNRDRHIMMEFLHVLGKPSKKKKKKKKFSIF